MEKNILDFKNRNEFREWLMENALKEEECYLFLSRGKPTKKDVFYYLDAVEEALCFGWIDSVCKPVNGLVMQRFSPRKKNSPWSELNKERVRRLEKLGLMTNLGRRVFPKTKFKMDKEVEQALKQSRCWTKFKKFPSLYQRVRVYNVVFYRTRDPKVYEKSLKHLIDETKKEKMFGEWNDYGRLLDY